MNRIRKRDLLKIFFRSFYIQGSWNFERMLGLGLCFCLIPIARRLCRTKEEKEQFLQRHLDFFNAQPYMASFALGAITRLEEQAIYQKWDDKRVISVFKERICGPLGALGDAFFWNFLKPFAASVGVIVTLIFGIAGIFSFLIIYNIPHLYIRAYGIFRGYFMGFDIIRELSISGTKKYFHGLSITLNLALGVLLVISSNWTLTKYGIDGFVVFLITLLLTLSLTYKRKLSNEMIIILVLCISIIIGLMI